MENPTPSQPPKPAHEKLPPLPPGARLAKRPLHHRRHLPALYKSPTIFVSSRTPHMAIIKRAQKVLDKALRNTAAAPRNASLHSRVAALERGAGSGNGNGNGNGKAGGAGQVRLSATGKAIERAIHAASWFEQQRRDCTVTMITDTMATVDDLKVATDDDCFGAADESRLRYLSSLEVCIALK